MRFSDLYFEPGGSKGCKVLLLLSWLLGLLLGACLFAQCDPALFTLMRMAALQPVSIVGLLITGLLPFLFAVLAAYTNMAIILCCVCFAKASVFSYISCALAGCFWEAGWLVWLLVLFSDIVGCVALLIYTWRHLDSREFSRWDTVCFGLLVLAAAGMEYYIFAPFFLELMK